MKRIGIFNVRIVRQGDAWGKDDCLIKNDPEPLVEFYDTRYMHTKRGQFVSNYYVSTLLKDNGRKLVYGLCLDAGDPAWTLSPSEVDDVIAYIQQEGA